MANTYQTPENSPERIMPLENEKTETSTTAILVAEPKIEEDSSVPEFKTRFSVIAEAFMESNMNPYTVFREHGNTKVWMRPSDNFNPDDTTPIVDINTGWESDTITLGEYIHFKGGRYRLICEAVLVGAPLITEFDEKTEETNTFEPRYAIYISDNNKTVFARPVKNFTELVSGKNDELVPRFKKVPS